MKGFANGTTRNEKGLQQKNGCDRVSRGVLPGIFVSLLVDLIAFTMILPLFPSILEKYRTDDSSGLYTWLADVAYRLANVMGTTPSQTETVLIGGILGSTFCFLQFLSSPIVGAISDTNGRRICLLGCLIGIIGSHVMWLFADDFATFTLARILGGLARANVSICTTIVADDSKPENRGKGMAMIGGAFSIGFTVGPGLGAYFAKVGDFRTPAFLCTGLSLLSFLLVYVFVPETLPDEKRSTKKRRDLSLYLWPPSLFRFSAVSSGKGISLIGLTYFIYIFFYSGLEFTLTFLTHAKLGYTPREQGLMFAFVGITMAFIQGVLTRRLKAGLEGPSAMFGIFIMIPSFILIGFASDTTVLAAGLVCYSIGSAIVGPCLTSLAASRVGSVNENGVAMGIFRSLGAMARSFGPALASVMFWKFGPEITYGLGSIAFLFPLFLLRNGLEKHKQA